MPEGPLASDPLLRPPATLPAWLPATTLAAMRAARDGRRPPNEGPSAAVRDAVLGRHPALPMTAVAEAMRAVLAERGPGDD